MVYICVVFFYVCMHIYECHSVVCVFRSEDNFYFQVAPRYWIKVIGAGSIACLAILVAHLIKDTVQFILWQFHTYL